MKPSIRIRLVKEKPFYGPGPHLLLQLTHETGSLREACRNMGISYSKGRTIIARLEQQLGFPVIVSQQGGKTGGNSVVTPEGKELMQNYAGFMEEIKKRVDEVFTRYFT
ncbi:MAG: LysR family transcriptional regulator [Defluviitaleaceae bacterium]|nr:LysR family transcriptional regulator [Defluviitaleaceae bacterium]